MRDLRGIPIWTFFIPFREKISIAKPHSIPEQGWSSFSLGQLSSQNFLYKVENMHPLWLLPCIHSLFHLEQDMKTVAPFGKARCVSSSWMEEYHTRPVYSFLNCSVYATHMSVFCHKQITIFDNMAYIRSLILEMIDRRESPEMKTENARQRY